MNQNKSKNLSSLLKNLDGKDIFSRDFKKTPIVEISSQLAEKGFFIFEEAMQSDYVDAIIHECTKSKIGYNFNDVSPVRNFRQTFFSNCLGSSQSVVNLIASEVVFEIAKAYLGPEFRLKCQRYYESGKGYQLGWHTDNKTVDNKKTEVRGVVFIFYLCDTFAGELEVVSGSNNWSGDSLSNDFDDDELRKNYAKEIISLAGKKGSLIITDTWTVHRTAMLNSSHFRRKSIFFQIDNDIMHSEKLLINPEFFPREMSPEMLRFFGFGLPSGYKTMPFSGLNTLTTKDLANLFFDIVYYLVLRMPYVKRIKEYFGRGSANKSNVING